MKKNRGSFLSVFLKKRLQNSQRKSISSSEVFFAKSIRELRGIHFELKSDRVIVFDIDKKEEKEERKV